MGIRVTMVAALLPVFFVLGLLSALIEHYLVKEELIWGLKEEAGGVALGVASFLDRHSVLSPEIIEARLARFPEIVDGESVLGLAQVDLAGGNVLHSAGVEPETVRAKGLGRETFTSEPMLSAGRSVINAVVPVRGPEGDAVEAIHAVVDASRLDHILIATRHSQVLRVIFITALALPVGWIFAGLLARRINRSLARAEEILENPTPKRLRSTSVRELDDVNEMIEILAALIEERRTQTGTTQ